MNKTAIKNFAIWARNKLIADVSYDARLIAKFFMAVLFMEPILLSVIVQC